MSYKAILLHVDENRSCGERTRIAVDLAVAFEAQLTGFYALNNYPWLSIDSLYMPEIIDQYQRLMAERMRRAADLFRHRTTRSGIAAEWRHTEDVIFCELTTSARYADLLIVGQTDSEDKTSGTPVDLPQVVCLSTGRPVLIVPYLGTFPSVGERILVAWNGSREAARAVSDALPLLQRAKQTHLLSIHPTSEPDIAAADMARFLARHGVEADTVEISAEDSEVGELLLSQASDLNADLLVMGAYGHSRLRELTLGGATRTILREMTIPVLMSH